MIYACFAPEALGRLCLLLHVVLKLRLVKSGKSCIAEPAAFQHRCWPVGSFTPDLKRCAPPWPDRFGLWSILHGSRKWSVSIRLEVTQKTPKSMWYFQNKSKFQNQIPLMTNAAISYVCYFCQHKWSAGFFFFFENIEMIYVSNRFLCSGIFLEFFHRELVIAISFFLFLKNCFKYGCAIGKLHIEQGKINTKTSCVLLTIFCKMVVLQ